LSYCTIAQLTQPDPITHATGYFNVNGVQFSGFFYDATNGFAAGMAAIVTPIAIGNYAVGFDVNPGGPGVWYASDTASVGFLELDYNVTVGGGLPPITGGLTSASFFQSYSRHSPGLNDGSVSTAGGSPSPTTVNCTAINPFGSCNGLTGASSDSFTLAGGSTQAFTTTANLTLDPLPSDDGGRLAVTDLQQLFVESPNQINSQYNLIVHGISEGVYNSCANSNPCNYTPPTAVLCPPGTGLAAYPGCAPGTAPEVLSFPVSTPEPGILGVLSVGLGGLWMVRRRRPSQPEPTKGLPVDAFGSDLEKETRLR
jgi:hypothetical protein